MHQAWPIRALSRLLREFSKIAPDIYAINAALLGFQFWYHNGRLPRRIDAAGADITDFVFHRAIGAWSEFERTCVDKATAKAVACSLCPAVQVSRTIGTFDMELASFAQFSRWLAQFHASSTVVKSTHGSGAVLFMDSRAGPTSEAIRTFYALSNHSYFNIWRERQYLGLRRKVIAEERLVAPGQPLQDYKFFCTRGQVLLCQVDIDRFQDHRRALVDAPNFVVLDVAYRYPRPNLPPERPARWRELIQCAEQLSMPFDFVRVDLYETEVGVFFGEFTFTPESGFGKFSSQRCGIDLLTRVKRRCETVMDDGRYLGVF